MKPVWAAQFDRGNVSVLGNVRTTPGVFVGENAQSIWICGESLDEPLELALRKLSGAVRFAVFPDGQLLAPGARVPKGRLPALQWVSLREWVQLKAQPAALSGESPSAIPIRLVRTTGDAPATVLVTDWRSFAAFAARAPEVRLRPLHFATATDGRTLVRGNPLPPLPGPRFFEHSGVAIPCGYRIDPPLESAVLQELLQLSRGDLALFHADGSFERIAISHFVAATRSAARMTQEVNAV